MAPYMLELFATAGLVAMPNRPRDFNAVVVETMPAAGCVRHVHRERDFGVGYGNSSGYAADRRYVSEWSPQRFRCF
ncbi:hypothetical protein [Lysobacter tyrosinilyticus]